MEIRLDVRGTQITSGGIQIDFLFPGNVPRGHGRLDSDFDFTVEPIAQEYPGDIRGNRFDARIPPQVSGLAVALWELTLSNDAKRAR